MSYRSYLGNQNPNWKGGIRKGHKYVRVYHPEHPNVQKDGYIFEHRYVMSMMLGRLLLKTEIVHHKNKNTKDNRPENLELFSSDSLHRHFTIRDKENPNYRHGRNVVRL